MPPSHFNAFVRLCGAVRCREPPGHVVPAGALLMHIPKGAGDEMKGSTKHGGAPPSMEKEEDHTCSSALINAAFIADVAVDDAHFKARVENVHLQINVSPKSTAFCNVKPQYAKETISASSTATKDILWWDVHRP